MWLGVSCAKLSALVRAGSAGQQRILGVVSSLDMLTKSGEVFLVFIGVNVRRQGHLLEIVDAVDLLSPLFGLGQRREH